MVRHRQGLMSFSRIPTSSETVRKLRESHLGGSFKPSLQRKATRPLLRIPPTGVGGSFKSSLQRKATRPLLRIPPTPVGGIPGVFAQSLKLRMLQ